MKKLILLLGILLSAAGARANFTNDVIACTNLYVVNGPWSDTIIPGYIRITSDALPSLFFNAFGNSPDWGAAGGVLYFSAALTNGVIDSSQEGYHFDHNLFVNGGVYSINSYQTNVIVVWSTNAFFAYYATNTPDAQPIPWKAGTNVWTGTNTYSGTVNLNGPVKVNGAGGGTSNVPMGGVTFHFVNGFYTGATTP
jgi:hypothetical protein